MLEKGYYNRSLTAMKVTKGMERGFERAKEGMKRGLDLCSAWHGKESEGGAAREGRGWVPA